MRLAFLPLPTVGSIPLNTSDVIMRSILVLSLGCAAIVPARAQNKLSIVVKTTVLEVHGDTVRTGYAVTNSPASRADLFAFTVDAPVPVLAIERPLHPPHVMTDDAFAGRRVASWGFVDPTLAAGKSTSTLAYSARGVPGVVKYWAMPYAAPDTVDTPEVTAASAATGPGATAADSGFTVGVVPAPTDRSRAGLLRRLATLLDDACLRGWIDNAGVCNSLRVKIEHDQTDALLNELSAQRGKHVNETAYFLLAGNVWALPN